MLDVINESILSLVEYGIAAKDYTVLFDVYELLTEKHHPSTTTKKVVESSKFHNLFVDDGSVPQESEEIVKKLYNPPAQSNRPPTNYINVKCSQCGKEVTVHPSLYVSPHSFRCDGCY